MVDFSETVPKRVSERPTDEIGDFDQINLNETTKEYEVKRHALFFSDPGTREIYKGHVKELLERRNKYSGVLYKEDPTIFAWNLINEPRCETWLVWYSRDGITDSFRNLLVVRRSVSKAKTSSGPLVSSPSARRHDTAACSPRPGRRT